MTSFSFNDPVTILDFLVSLEPISVVAGIYVNITPSSPLGYNFQVFVSSSLSFHVQVLQSQTVISSQQVVLAIISIKKK